ncbi:MAG: WD40 repeat domain-containing protein [Campylobacterota bacterium]
MRPDHRVSTPSGIHALQSVGEDKLAALGTDNSVRVYDLRTFDLVGGFKTLVTANELSIKNAAISPNGAFVSLYDQDQKAQAVYYTKTKKLLYTITRHKGMTESCVFAPKSHYLATGGQDGRVYLWSMKTGKIALTLPFHSDYVSTLAFSANGRWVASGGFDNTIYVTNISSMNQKITLGSHKAAVTRVVFISKQRLVSADKEGQILVWDYTGARVIHRFEKMRAEVTALAAGREDGLLFAVDESRRVCVYDLQRYKLLDTGLITLGHRCYSLEYSSFNDTLTFGLKNGQLLFFALFQEENQMQQLLGEKKLTRVYELLDKNPMLYYTQSYRDLEQEWEFDFDMAGELLAQGSKDEAKQLLQPYQAQSHKRLMTQRLFKDYGAYERFKKAAVLKKYPLAYSIATQYPILQQTKYFQKMEQTWEAVLDEVKEVISTKEGEEKATRLLLPFKGVASKASLIRSIFEQRQVITLFQKKIAEDNYNEAFLLAKKHPFLENFEDYEHLVQVSQNIENKARKKLQEGDYAQAVRFSERLAEFPGKKDISKELYAHATAYAQAMHDYAQKNFAHLYKVVEKYPFLEESDMIERLENSWAKRVYKAEIYASRAQAKEVYKLFAKFVQIPVKLPKIAELLKLAYANGILQSTRDEKVPDTAIKRAVEYYVYLFGIDTQIRDTGQVVQSRRPRCKINFDMMMQIGDDRSWVKKKLPADIVKMGDG